MSVNKSILNPDLALSFWQAQVQQLAEKIVDTLKSAPGSGKSTIAYPLTDRINTLLHRPSSTVHPTGVKLAAVVAESGIRAGQGDQVAICVGLDGWHLTRAELDAFADPVEAHWRRGAPFTFDLSSYHAFLVQLRIPLLPHPPPGIPFPTFDHALKDPSPGPEPIRPQHRIVVIEGLYTLLDRDGWRECAEMMDVRVYIEVEAAVSRDRVIKRNFQAGIVDSLEKCAERVDAVDMVNGEEVRSHLFDPTFIIHSTDSQGFVPPADPAMAVSAIS
ncbi:MAG: hypothetical protein TREMPRED_000887 [Tremellales sp. Tagirdzhanova-0007]|nr:MAG: hypothetical protein TREMPRED_000887 [Tremellales sp. Tagirdzhanova-0007]